MPNRTPIHTDDDQLLKAPVTLESRASLRSSQAAVLASSGFLERVSPFHLWEFC
nr:hypothetical protein [Halovivax sp. KZCA124]